MIDATIEHVRVLRDSAEGLKVESARVRSSDPDLARTIDEIVDIVEVRILRVLSGELTC